MALLDPHRPSREQRLESYLIQEAAAGERYAARIRLLLLLGLLVLSLLASAFVSGPRRPLPTILAVLTIALGYAAAVDILVRRRYWPFIAYLTVLVDVFLVTTVVLAAAVAVGQPHAATKSGATLTYFLMIAAAGLRQQPALALFAGIVSAVGYLVLLVPMLLYAPDRILFTAGMFADLSGPTVSLIRVGVHAAMLVLSGGIVALGTSRARRLASRVLDTLTFLFADLREYTHFVESHGDAPAAELISTYRQLVREELARSGGGEIKTEGDSFFLVFPTARQALHCAMGILRAAQRHNARRPNLPLRIGIGIHAGEPEVRDGGYVGSAVNIAARLGQQAGAGEILVSDVVRGLLRTSDLPPVRERPEVPLKGVLNPPRIYVVDWDLDAVSA